MSCPCGGENYKVCYQKFHQKKEIPTAVELMCSRYSAYALALTDYIIETTDWRNPINQESYWKESIKDFSRKTTFIDLKVHKFCEEEKLATVIFSATLFQNDQDLSFTTKSGKPRALALG